MRVRLPRLDGVDLNLFQFDFDLTMMIFFLNADEHIYGRYGGRDGKNPDGRHSLAGLRYAMQAALDDAGVDAGDIDYINAHGTSTPANDATETAAIKLVFGEEGARAVAISSTKSMTGHLLGGAGALESLVCLLAIRDGVLPPTINLEAPDPDCDLDYVPNQARRQEI